MDASSELIHALLPLFLVRELGATILAVGLIEGLAEATAALTKILSGGLSDRLRRRKVPTLLGYGLAAATKPVFPLAGSLAWICAARFVDRVGKGIRGAPRDALIADITPPEQRGAAFGLRQSLDSVGAVIGPVAAIVGLRLLDADIRRTLWIATLPALIAVLVIAFGVREPTKNEGVPPTRKPWSFFGVRGFSRRFWSVVVLAAVFTLARFSEAFLILRALDLGLSPEQAPLVMVAMNVVYAAFAYPLGRVADRGSRRGLALAGLGLLIAADVVLAAASSAAAVLLGAALWGLHSACTPGLFAKWVAEAAPPDRRGQAFGLFHLVSGLALLLASGLAGLLWSRFGPGATFAAGAFFAGAAALGIPAIDRGAARRA